MQITHWIEKVLFWNGVADAFQVVELKKTVFHQNKHVWWDFAQKSNGFSEKKTIF